MRWCQKYIDTYATFILNAKYETFNNNDVAFGQQHLVLDQCCDLHASFSKHTKMFDDSFGVYPHQNIYIDLKQGTKLVQICAFPTPNLHRQTFKKELPQVQLDILDHCQASKWVSPAFIITE